MSVRKTILAYASCLFLAVAVGNSAEELNEPPLSGQCTGVRAGDLLEVTIGEKATLLKLSGVASPLPGQPFFEEARRAMIEHAYLRSVEISDCDELPDGALYGTASVGGRDLSAVLVREGFAWCVDSSDADASLKDMELTARRERVGLWEQADPEPPWVYAARTIGQQKKAVAPEEPSKPRTLRDVAATTSLKRAAGEGEGGLVVEMVGVPQPQAPTGEISDGTDPGKAIDRSRRAGSGAQGPPSEAAGEEGSQTVVVLDSGFGQSLVEPTEFTVKRFWMDGPRLEVLVAVPPRCRRGGTFTFEVVYDWWGRVRRKDGTGSWQSGAVTASGTATLRQDAKPVSVHIMETRCQ